MERQRRRVSTAIQRRPRQPIPGNVIKHILASRGVVTMNQAKQFGALNGISPETIAQIVRETRKTITFETADRIVCALDSPELWYGPLSKWYYPEGTETEAFRAACAILETGELVR